MRESARDQRGSSMHVRRDETRCRVRVLVVAVPAIHSIPFQPWPALVCLLHPFSSPRRYTTSFTHDNSDVSLTTTLVSTRLCCLTSLPTSPFPAAAQDSTVSPRAHHRYQQRRTRTFRPPALSSSQSGNTTTPTLDHTKPRAAHHSTANVE